MNTEGTGFYTCKECRWKHTTIIHKEREQSGGQRNVGKSSCNCGDGTGRMAQPLMFMMMMMMIYFNRSNREHGTSPHSLITHPASDHSNHLSIVGGPLFQIYNVQNLKITIITTSRICKVVYLAGSRWDPKCVFNFLCFFERTLYKSNYIIFILSWFGTHTKIGSKFVDIVMAGSQKITLWGPQRTPFGVLRVKNRYVEAVQDIVRVMAAYCDCNKRIHMECVNKKFVLLKTIWIKVV